jgi:hypothetical protein
MKYAVATLMIASLGASYAVARPNDKTKSADQTTTSSDSSAKKHNKKYSKKHAADSGATAQPASK